MPRILDGDTYLDPVPIATDAELTSYHFSETMHTKAAALPRSKWPVTAVARSSSALLTKDATNVSLVL